jgi:two-component system CheB/CheR fusion protein
LEAVNMVVAAIASGQPYDMVLLDMQMPVMDGYQAAKQLREMGCDIPIIAATAHAMKGDRQRCIEAGCSDYLTKPLDRQKLLAMVSGHLERQPIVSETKSRRVLVVDDSIEVCDALEMLLEAEDHTVAKAFDGPTTLQLIESFKPELVLLDLGLPEMSGFEVLRIAKDAGIADGVVFVALTGQANPEETKAAGFDHHMLKPVDVEQLERFVATI